MRILAVTNLYPNPYQPNRATFNRHQFRLLSETHALRVIAPILWTDERSARRNGKPPLQGNRQVVHDGLTVDHPRYWYTPFVLRSWYGRFFLWSVRSTFRRAVAEFQPDLVLASWAYPDAWAAVRLSRAAGLPVVVKVHGSDVRLLDDIRGRHKGTADALRRADGVIAVSQDLADRVIRLGVDPARVRVIGNGVDRTVFNPGNREAARTRLGFRPGIRHLLFVGNLVAVKGIDVLITACSKLPGRVGPWELHVVGEGRLREELVRQAQRLGLSGRVHFHGSQPHADLPDWFRACDLLVLASRSEGTPNVLLEAAACGTPFVATKVGGIPEVAHLGASRLVPSEDPDALAHAISASFEDPLSPPKNSPRSQREAVSELASFLRGVFERYHAGRPNPPLVHSLPSA